MSRHRPFSMIASLAASVVAAFVLLTPARMVPAHEQGP